MSNVQTSWGSPHNLRKYKSDSDTIIPGGNLSAPRGFEGSHTYNNCESFKTYLNIWFCSWKYENKYVYIKTCLWDSNGLVISMWDNKGTKKGSREIRLHNYKMVSDGEKIWQEEEKIWRERRRTWVIHKDGKDSPRRIPKAIANNAVVRSFMPSSDLLLLLIGL